MFRVGDQVQVTLSGNMTLIGGGGAAMSLGGGASMGLGGTVVEVDTVGRRYRIQLMMSIGGANQLWAPFSAFNH